MITLYKHQQDIVDLFPKKQGIFWGLGTGKTYAALALAQKTGEKTLIICPKMLREKWQRDAEEWKVDCLVVTKEEFRRDFKTLPACGTVIIDECHQTFASLKSKGHKALMLYLKVRTPEYVYPLTGTPYTSTPFSIFALARILGHKWDWVDFRRKYFVERYMGNRVIFEPRTGIENEIAELARQIGTVVRLDECIDVPQQTFAEESFEMTVEQKKEMKHMQATESNPLTRFGLAHQIAQGILIGDEYTVTKTFPALKNQRVVALAQENEKMVVFSRYNAHLRLLSDMLDKEGILNTIINGDTKDRDGMIRAADSSKRIVLLVQDQCGTGWEAPSFSIMIHASHGYSFVEYLQAMGRILRINAPKPNYYLSLSTKGSADLPVRKAMKEKEDFHEAIFIRENLEI